jgi:hypothetical protein
VHRDLQTVPMHSVVYMLAGHDVAVDEAAEHLNSGGEWD